MKGLSTLLTICALASCAGCASPERSPSHSESEPTQWFNGSVVLVNGIIIAGRVGVNPNSDEIAIRRDDTTTLLPKSEVARIIINDPDRRRDPWELKGPDQNIRVDHSSEVQ